MPSVLRWLRTHLATRRARLLLGLACLVAIAGAAAYVALSSAVMPVPATDPVLSRIRGSGKLIVCLDPSFPPFESYGDHNKIEGFDVDVAMEIARRMGV